LRRALFLAVAAFVLVLIMRLPARWIGPLLPHGIHCRQLDGTAWHGSCAGLSTGGGDLGDLAWNLHALQLLRGRLEAQLDLAGPGSQVSGTVALGVGGALHGRDVSVDLPLTSALVSAMPGGAHARLLGRLSRIEWTGRFMSQLQGEIDIQDLVGPSGQVFGSYQAIFGPESGSGAADSPTGVIRDTAGVLALDGTLQLTHDPGWVLNGHVAARPGASADIADIIQHMQSPDATGRHPFTLTSP